MIFLARGRGFLGRRDELAIFPFLPDANAVAVLADAFAVLLVGLPLAAVAAAIWRDVYAAPAPHSVLVAALVECTGGPGHLTFSLHAALVPLPRVFAAARVLVA